MGQKVNPIGFRLGQGLPWSAKWFSRANYPELLEEDVKIRKAIKKIYPDAGIARVEVVRSADEIVQITLHTSKPGLVIGRGGAGVEDLRTKIDKQVLKGRRKLQVNIQEVRAPYLSAEIVLQESIQQIERRMPFRRVLKNTVAQVMEAGAKGVKISIGGRLNGSDIARTEKLAQGSMPLHTIRADIDYARGTAHTTFGTIGIKVWINRGERKEGEDALQQEDQSDRRQYARRPQRKKI
jgi:small subunit ribosomal protein S3